MKRNNVLATCIVITEYVLAYTVGVVLAICPNVLVASAGTGNDTLEKVTSSLLLLTSTYMMYQFYKCTDEQCRIEIVQSNLVFWGMFTLSLSLIAMMEHGSRDVDSSTMGFLFLFLCNCLGLLITYTWPNSIVLDETGDDYGHAPTSSSSVRRRRNAKTDDRLSKPLLDLPDDEFSNNSMDSSACGTCRTYSIPHGVGVDDDDFYSSSSSADESSSNASIIHSTANETKAQQQQQAKKDTSRLKGIGRLLQLAQPEKMTLFIGCVVLCIRLPFSLSIPHFVAETFGALTNDDYDDAKHQVLLLVVAGSIDAALDFWCVYLFGKVNQSIIRELRTSLFHAIVVQEMSFFDASSTGELLSRLSADCGSMSGDLTWFFRFSIEATVRVVVIVAYMFFRCPKLAATACSVIPIVAFLNKVYGDWLGQNAKAVQDSLADTNKIAQEAISCIKTVIAYAAEDVEHNKYSKMVKRNYALNMQQQFAMALYYMLISTFLINTCVKAVLLYYGVVLYMSGELDAHILIAFMLYQDTLQVSESQKC